MQKIQNSAIVAGQFGIKKVATKEAEKVVVEKTIKTVVTDTIEIAALNTATNSMETLLVNTAEKAVTNSIEKIALESSKQLVQSGFKEGANIMIDVAKEGFIGVMEEGGEQILVSGSKESVKTITETILIKQGGKPWLINLGKVVPIIGTVISASMNTYTTAILGKRMVDKLDKEFEDNQQRQVDLIKGIIYGIFNIIEQMKSIIEDEHNEIKF